MAEELQAQKPVVGFKDQEAFSPPILALCFIWLSLLRSTVRSKLPLTLLSCATALECFVARADSGAGNVRSPGERRQEDEPEQRGFSLFLHESALW